MYDILSPTNSTHLPTYENNNETDCNNYSKISPLLTTYTTLSTFFPCREEGYESTPFMIWGKNRN
jgi:hypothetical protein